MCLCVLLSDSYVIVYVSVKYEQISMSFSAGNAMNNAGGCEAKSTWR